MVRCPLYLWKQLFVPLQAYHSCWIQQSGEGSHHDTLWGLCAGDSLVEVYNPDGDPLDSILTSDGAPAPHTESAAVFGIRNLLGVSDAAAAGQMAPHGAAGARLAAAGPTPSPAAPGPRPVPTGPGRGPRKGAPQAAAGPAAARAGQDSGVKAMATRKEADVGAVCHNNAYELPLHYGQNSFRIRVTTAAAMDEVRLQEFF